MPVYANRVQMTTATTGTGTVTLGSATPGFQTFASAGVATGSVVSYLITDGTAWEVGTGTYTSTGTTLSRTLVQSSTGSLLNLSGAAVVSVIVSAADLTAFAVQNQSASFTTLTGTTSLTSPSLTNAGTLALSATGANVITGSTNGSERMRIDSSGNVGIGTNSPTTPLNVKTYFSSPDTAKNGAVRVNNYTASTYGMIEHIVDFGFYDGSTYTVSGNRNPIGTTASSMRLDNGFVSFQTNSGLTAGVAFTPTERMRIHASGGVSIGSTTDPGAGNLSVSGTYNGITPIAESMTLLGTLTTTSGSTQTLSGLTLTGYKFLYLWFTAVSHNSGTAQTISFGPGALSPTVSAANALNGFAYVNLSNGDLTGALSTIIPRPTRANDGYSSDCGYTTASTSVSITVSGGSFDSGSVKVYGVK